MSIVEHKTLEVGVPEGAEGQVPDGAKGQVPGAAGQVEDMAASKIQVKITKCLGQKTLSVLHTCL